MASRHSGKCVLLPRRLRCYPRRATTIVQATLVLHRVEANRYVG
ncbi:hypothetical protein [Micromonospora rifamycinica]